MAQKRRTTKKSSGSSAKRAAETRKKNEQALSKKKQRTAVLLFALAILLLCIAIIPGASLWGWIHNTMFGAFGFVTYVIPVLLGYLAVLFAMEKAVKAKAWQTVLFVVLLGGTIEIFRTDSAVFETLYDAMLAAYTFGETYCTGGGAVGTLLGYPMESLFTDIGSKIILILALFVFIMLSTGTSIVALLRAFKRPEKEEKDEQADTKPEKPEKSKKGAKIDVALDDEYPEETKAEDEDVGAALQQQIREMQQEEEPQPEPEADPPTEVVIEPEEDDVPPFEVEEAPIEEVAYCFPPLTLLNEAKSADAAAAAREQNATAELLTQTLQEFGVSAKVVDVSCGPTVTRYELQPSAGVKISRITGLADDIALRLATTGVRIEAPIPNKAAIGIEVPNKTSSGVGLRELLESKEFQNAKSRLTVALGRDIGGQTVVVDLAKMPHLLIAGTTGSGKSVCTNSMIQSVLFHATPDEVRLLLIDPKQVEFGIYNGIPHLLTPVVTDPNKAAGALGWAVKEMLDRYKLFAENNVRDLEMYNELAKTSDTLKVLPQYLIVIDELADLMMVAANAVESNICRLAQMARAAGMHLVIATQRPSVDVITGLIKANIPSRLALTVASAVDSRTIIDTGGAEKLLGKGDMLFMPVGLAKPMRVQGCFVGNREVEAVVSFLKQQATQQYDESVIEEINRQAAAAQKPAKAGIDGDDDLGGADPMMPQAVELILEAGKASTSMLQSRLRLGYARANRIMDEMEQRGIVGPPEGSKGRQILITRQQWIEMSMVRPDDEQGE